MTKYVYKKTIKYNKLKEYVKSKRAKDRNWHTSPVVYESDMVSIRRRMVARDKIEEMLEAKELSEL